MTELAAQALARWAHLYSDDKAVSATVTYFHLAGIMLGGGVAVVADRSALQLAARTGAVIGPPAGGRSVHRWVVAGLGVIVVSGLLMMLADLHTYLTSPVFWVKMGLTLGLLGNGYVRVRAERAIARGTGAAVRWFRRASIASLVLWFVILLAGTLLVSAD
jgi:hypothetical protein